MDGLNPPGIAPFYSISFIGVILSMKLLMTLLVVMLGVAVTACRSAGAESNLDDSASLSQTIITVKSIY